MSLDDATPIDPLTNEPLKYDRTIGDVKRPRKVGTGIATIGDGRTVNCLVFELHKGGDLVIGIPDAECAEAVIEALETIIQRIELKGD